MSRSLGYIRKFIIFKKDYSNMYGYNPRGHGKLEIKGLKGNIAINIENAEPDVFYNIAFVDRRDSEIIGKIYTEEKGKGKADIFFNLNELAAKGFSVDEINGILIFRDTNVLLGGYILKEDNSLEEFIQMLPNEIIQTVAEEETVEELVEEESEEPNYIEEEIQDDVEKLEVVDSLEEEFVPAEVYEEEVIPPIEAEDVQDEYMVPAVESIIEEDVPGEYMVPAVESLIEEDVPEEYMVPAAESLIEEDVPEEYMVPAVESIPEEVLTPIADEELETSGHLDQEESPVQEAYDENDETPRVEYIDDYEEQNEGLAYGAESEIIIDDPSIYMSSSTTYGYDNIEVTRKVTQKNQTTNYILNILRYFPYIEPFKLDLYGYNWWKIDFEDGEDPRGFLPYFSLLIGGDHKYNKTKDYSVTAKDLMRKYEHYIFGLYNVNDEVKFYVYGIPGAFSKEEHPHKGTTGFNTWFEGIDVDGYWLLYIDPLQGKIIYPANPMVPTN